MRLIHLLGQPVKAWRLFLLAAVLFAAEMTFEPNRQVLYELFGFWEPALCNAVAEGDLNKVRTLVARGANLNVTDTRGRTPLYYAAWYDEPEIADFLISRGADPNRGASWKGFDTPLHRAAYHGSVRVAKVLIEHGVKADLRNSSEATPLHIAAWHGHPDVVRHLISQGADVNAQDKNRNTPLVYSGRGSLGEEYTRHDEEIAVLLVEAGANINHVNRFGDSALRAACGLGNTNVVEYLLKHGANPNLNMGSESLLEWAARSRKTGIETLLRKYGAK